MEIETIKAILPVIISVGLCVFGVGGLAIVTYKIGKPTKKTRQEKAKESVDVEERNQKINELGRERWGKY